MDKISVVLDLAFGDTGKGKIVDIFSKDFDAIARFNGGDNSGHVVIVNGVKKVLHLIPSGALHSDKILILGNGVVINPISLKNEIEDLEKLGLNIKQRLYISDKAHLITPIHKWKDETIESNENKIGSTKKGIGPTYADKYARIGIKVEDIKYGKVKDKYENYLNEMINYIEDENEHQARYVVTWWERCI